MQPNLTVKDKKPSQTVVLLIPVFHFIALILLSYWGVKIGYDKVKSQRLAILAAKKAETVLAEKESTLKSAVTQIPQYINAATIALPEKNPALFLISQLNYLSTQSAVSYSDLKIGAGGMGDETSVSLKFSVSGPYANMISFFKASKKIAPLLSIQKLEMSLSADNATANVALNSYWSSYPDKLPSVTEPINKITSENYKILNSLLSLKPPVSTGFKPKAPTLRENPFF